LLSVAQSLCDAAVDAGTGLLPLVASAILVEASFEAAQRDADIDHDVVHDEGIPGAKWLDSGRPTLRIAVYRLQSQGGRWRV